MTSQMFQCQIKPDVPDSGETDAVLASYIVRLALAHEDCEAQLSTVRHHLEINGIKVTNTGESQPSDESSLFLGLFK